MLHTYPGGRFLAQDTDAFDNRRAGVVDAIQQCLGTKSVL